MSLSKFSPDIDYTKWYRALYYETEQDYNTTFNLARSWILDDLEGKLESPLTTTRIYYINKGSLRKLVSRSLVKKLRNSYSLIPGISRPRILLDVHDKAIR